MNPNNSQKTISAAFRITIAVTIIGIFQGELRSYLIPISCFWVAFFFINKVLLPVLNKKCLSLISDLLATSNENMDVLSQGKGEAKTYYLHINDPRMHESLKLVLQAENTSLLFSQVFIGKLLNLSWILILSSIVLLIVLIFKANTYIVWLTHLIWLIPVLMIYSQIRNKKKLFKLFVKQIYYAKNNKLYKVISLAKKVGLITKRESGNRSYDYAICLFNLGGVYNISTDYKAAENAFQEAYDIWSEIGMKSDLNYVQSLYELANIYFTNSKFNNAEKHFLELLDIFESDNKSYIYIAKELSLIKLIQEDLSEVKKYNNKIESRIIKSYGKESDEYIHFQYYKHFMNMKEGNFTEAQSFYNKDLEKSIRGKLKGEELALFLQNQGMYYFGANNYEKAEEYFRESINIRTEYWGENHPSTANAKLDLGTLYHAMLEYSKGENLMRHAIKINKNCYGESSTKLARNYSELGNLLTGKGDYSQAEMYNQKALDLYRKLFSKSHPLYLNTMSNLGWLYDEMGDLKKAEKIINTVYVKTLNILGAEHPLLRAYRYQIASFKIRKGLYKEALALFKQIKITDDKIIKETFFLGGEQHKLNIMDRVFYDIDKTFSFIVHYMPNNFEAISFAMDLVLQRKAIVTDIITSQNKLFKPNADTLINTILKELSELKRKISHLQLEGFETISVSEYKNTVEKYNKRKIELEETIFQNIHIDLYKDILNDNIRELVSSKLGEEEVMIEFMKFNRFNFEGKRYENLEYFALMLFGNQCDNVKLIRLGNADTIDALIIDVLANIRANRKLEDFANDALMRPLTLLTDTILQPILDNCSTCEKIYIVPDGELYQFPFEMLLVDKGKFAIEKYQFMYLNSGRDLISFHRDLSEKNFTEGAIVADPDYNLTENETSHITNKKPNRFGLSLVKELRATKKEAEDISKILNVKQITNQEATKKKVLELSSPEYLHFATHGHFIPRNPSFENMGNSLINADNKSKHQISNIDNPMLRSALVLAGYNSWISHKDVPDEVGNGLLTAMNITEMDLSHTKLVVLSACETGLGDIDHGEGVFGLRRAFKIAGANRIVMSLWKVKDEETQIFMTDFYRLQHEDKLSFYKAFRKTQLKFINERNRNPYFWAAFIFQGIEN